MGDVIHTLPALTDAAAALPGLRVDWVVEAPFADLAGRHPAVDRVVKMVLLSERMKVDESFARQLRRKHVELE